MGSVLLCCLNEVGVAKLWLLRGLSASAYVAPLTESSNATRRNPAGLSELMVAGRTLEDNITGLLWQPGTFDEKLVSHSESGGKPVKVTAKDKRVN
ncbi:hypothetical protein llap_3418 [Limosa lapponica baueri]|uniref:Uncharacterized protein n=1 Tax=Limosa lapponica baueri TaxID=1758121 RepID=A0A2I0UJP2_LIMLA|nr:hypothetical protein llap_3418 [Limosa lapponica baueri]